MSFRNSSKPNPYNQDLNEGLVYDSKCLDKDATSLALPASLQAQFKSDSANEYDDSQLDNYWALQGKTLKGLTPGSESKAFTLEEELGEGGDWVLCPSKSEVPDADYAPNLRTRRPPNPKKLAKATARSKRVKRKNNKEPDVLIIIDLHMDIGPIMF
ncbi:hypothetical protein EGW08_018001 [Elysia chlorotica]|uniref:Uncharacterized protein n=1 Tax=Elysia chlorotica TaxID=188477 RepID=A0A3S0ZC15_ELYCH|nr:hypothetical protein EGW08_018001 [Elysia chlorotica]